MIWAGLRRANTAQALRRRGKEIGPSVAVSQRRCRAVGGLADPHGTGAWLRAQPPDTANRPGPRLRAPGAALFTTQPDGLWVWFGPEAKFADVLAIEVCGTVQNRIGCPIDSLAAMSAGSLGTKFLHFVPQSGDGPPTLMLDAVVSRAIAAMTGVRLRSTVWRTATYER